MSQDIELEIWKYLTGKLMEDSKDKACDYNKRLGKEPVAAIEVEMEEPESEESFEEEKEEFAPEEDTEMYPNSDPSDDPAEVLKSRLMKLRNKS